MRTRDIRRHETWEIETHGVDPSRAAHCRKQADLAATGYPRLARVEALLDECRCGGLACLPVHYQALQAQRDRLLLTIPCSRLIRVPATVAYALSSHPYPSQTKRELLAAFYPQAPTRYTRVKGTYDVVVTYPWYSRTLESPVIDWVRWSLAQILSD